MKRYLALLIVAACLLLSGCGSWMSDSYVSVTPHLSQSDDDGQDLEWISNEKQMYEAIHYMVRHGISEDVFFIRDYSESEVYTDMAQVRYQIINFDPVGAYAVENIQYEAGINGGRSTLAVNIEYSRQRSEIIRIKTVKGMQTAKDTVASALTQMDTKLVFYVEDYETIDFVQIVEDYAQENPDEVIEIPQVSVTVYPDSGSDDRVVEMDFTYQISRESLRTMQSQVEQIFESAKLYVTGDESTYETLSHLYVFLMGLNNYQTGTSLTPAYSLLRHGVGDSKAFAVVFAAMCRQAGIECLTVSGTRDGEPRFWNIVKDGDVYCHVDILRCAQVGEFRERSDGEMYGYVWDYSAYPACEWTVPIPEVTDEEPTEETEEETAEESLEDSAEDTTDPSQPEQETEAPAETTEEAAEQAEQPDTTEEPDGA